MKKLSAYLILLSVLVPYTLILGFFGLSLDYTLEGVFTNVFPIWIARQFASMIIGLLGFAILPGGIILASYLFEKGENGNLGKL